MSACFDDLQLWNTYAGAESAVTIIAATNEPWAIDGGFLRAGRLDRLIYVGPLDEGGRRDLFYQYYAKHIVKSATYDIESDNVTHGVGVNSSSLDSLTHPMVQHAADNPSFNDSLPASSYQSRLSILLSNLVACTHRFTGADCQLLVKRASLQCFLSYRDAIDIADRQRILYDSRSIINRDDIVLPTWKHFQEALKVVRASTSVEDIDEYEEWRASLKLP